MIIAEQGENKLRSAKLVGVLVQSWLNKKQRMQSRLQSCAEFRLSSWILSPAKGGPELIMAAASNIPQHHNYPSSQLSSTCRNNQIHLFPFKIRHGVIFNLQKYQSATNCLRFKMWHPIRRNRIRYLHSAPSAAFALHCAPLCIPQSIAKSGYQELILDTPSL